MLQYFLPNFREVNTLCREDCPVKRKDPPFFGDFVEMVGISAELVWIDPRNGAVGFWKYVSQQSRGNNTGQLVSKNIFFHGHRVVGLYWDRQLYNAPSCSSHFQSFWPS
jgi:hypothetical protein